MSIERDIALIDELRASPENSCLEFKRDNTDPNIIGKYCSALANAARIEGKDLAYLLWGIDDATHTVVGTAFNPDNTSVANQPLPFWLSQRLKPSLAFAFRAVPHPQGRVVILEVPAATSAPMEFDGTAYVRISSATPKLSDHPALFQKLVDNMRPYAWEKGIATGFLTADDILALIDYPAYFTLTGQPLPDNKAGILEKLEADSLIKGDVGGRWNITNIGAILFAKDLTKFNSALARKAIRFVAYDGDNRASTVTHRRDDQKGYATGFAELVSYINTLLPHNEHIGEAFRSEHPLYPTIAIRELVANALIHQDMTITGAGPQIELFHDRIEITNPGSPLVAPERMIDLPPRSRNEALASLMRRMRLCEEQGTGLDKVILNVEVYQLPAPKFQANEGSMQVVLYAPRSFANMTAPERIRACYQHAVLRYLSGTRLTNSSLRERFGLGQQNAGQISRVINAAMEDKQVKLADPEHPKAGYLPKWA